MPVQEKLNRNLWVDYLRSAVTVLVVAHHASLAYTTFAWFDKEAWIRSSNPVVDTKRWAGLDIFENYNDIFFMFLMFFIGGLFLSKSIARKGILTFIKDRTYRLLIPFLFGGTLFMLIAYFPSFYIAHNSTNVVDYIKDFFTIEQWPVGPPWFIWVLFAFNMLYAVSYSLFPKLYEKITNKIASLREKPVAFVLLLFFITWLLYVPVAYNIGAGTWTGFGPFDFQLSRILTYFGYFLLGVWIGSSDFNSRLLAFNAPLVKKWKLWILLSLVLYTGIALNGELHILANMVKDDTITAFSAWMIYYSLYVAVCAITCIAFITTFRRRVKNQKPWRNSLSQNAYLIYLVHYVFITWTQFSLLTFNIPAFVKFIIVFIASLLLSWGLSILLRKIKLINKWL